MPAPALLLALLVTAPPPPPPVPPPALPEEVRLALAAAEKMERDRAPLAAARQLDAIRPLAPPDLRPELGLRVCHLTHRGGDAPAAHRCFAQLAASATGDPDLRALARYHAAVLSAELGAPQAAEDMREALLSDPDTTGGLRALSWLREQRRRAGGVAAEADWLLGIASALGKSTTRHAEALVEAGRLALELGKAARASSILASARAAAAGTVWADDALIWSARAARAEQRWPEAVAAYEELIATHEVSLVVGSYDSEHLDDAMLEVGQMLEGLGRADAAAAAYARLLRSAPDSRGVDDAAYGLARLAGTPAALSDFLAAYPDSRHRRAAAARLAPARR